MTSHTQQVPHLGTAVQASLAPPARPVPEHLAAPAALPSAANGVRSRSAGAPGAGAAAAVPAPGSRALRTRLFLVDLVSAVVGWVGVGFATTDVATALARLAPGAAAACTSLFAMRATGLYRSRLCTRKVDEVGRIVVSGMWGAAAYVLVLQVSGTPGPAVLACWAAFSVVAATLRLCYGRWLRARRAEGRYLRRVVLVGTNDDAADLRTMLRSEPELGYAVSAVVGDATGDPAWRDLPSSTSVADIPSLASATGATGILVVPYGVSSDVTQRAIAVAASRHLHVQMWPGFRGVGSRRLRTVPVSGEAFFYVEPRVSSRWKLAAKRAIDVAGAATVLAVSAPVVAVAALAVKLEDRGPVLHVAERVGRFGRPIRVHKLRSMVPGAGSLAPVAAANERTDGPLFKSANDPRVTRVGRFIRATSIDELPQLWDVLRGTMSLVGPRPALPAEVARFDEELQRRHSVRPGLTGLWQVEARDNPSFNAYRRLDLRYVDNWSLTMDLSILLATVPTVLAQGVRAIARSRRG